MKDDGIVQSFCNDCGAQLEILVVNKDNKVPYRCPKCGQGPSSVDRVEPQNLGKSYVVNLRPRGK